MLSTTIDLGSVTDVVIKLYELLIVDPQPGLASWNECVALASSELLALIMNGGTVLKKQISLREQAAVIERLYCFLKIRPETGLATWSQAVNDGLEELIKLTVEPV